MRTGWVVVALLAGAGSARAQSQSRERLADLDALAGWVEAEASFSDEGRRHAFARIDSIRDQGPAGDLAAFFLHVASVVGLADDAHSNLDRGPAVRLGLIPLRTYWFADGLHVVRARPDHADLVGARIDSIGGVGVDELVGRLGVYHGGTDAHFRHYLASELFISPPVMHAAGVAERADRLTLSVTRVDDAHDRVTATSRSSPGSPTSSSVPTSIRTGSSSGSGRAPPSSASVTPAPRRSSSTTGSTPAAT